MSVLEKISPSQIDSFDDSTPFGCNRRWYFEKVMKLPVTEKENLLFGTKVHSVIEATWGNLPVQVEPEVLRVIEPGLHVIQEVKRAYPRSRLEEWCQLQLAGVTINGRIDVVLETAPSAPDRNDGFCGILDWKTSSNIERYGKRGLDLKKATPMMVYLASHLALQGKNPMVMGHALPEETFILKHVTFQTKGRAMCVESETRVTRQMVDNFLRTVTVPLVEAMKVAATKPDASEVAPTSNPQKCGRCDFADRCSSSPKAKSMNLLDRLLKKPSATPTPPPASPAVLPPDAPASKPELAAKPVEGFVVPKVESPAEVLPAPVPETTQPHVEVFEKKEPKVKVEKFPMPTTSEEARAVVAQFTGKKGRRPAAYTRALEILGMAGQAEAPVPVPAQVEAPKPVEPTPLPVTRVIGVIGPKLTKVWVEHSLTVNLGNYNSAKVSIGAEAEADDFDAAVASLTEQVKSKLLVQLNEYDSAGKVGGGK